MVVTVTDSSLLIIVMVTSAPYAMLAFWQLRRLCRGLSCVCRTARQALTCSRLPHSQSWRSLKTLTSAHRKSPHPALTGAECTCTPILQVLHAVQWEKNCEARLNRCQYLCQTGRKYMQAYGTPGAER